VGKGKVPCSESRGERNPPKTHEKGRGEYLKRKMFFMLIRGKKRAFGP